VGAIAGPVLGAGSRKRGLVAAPGGSVTYRIVSQQEFFENVPGFPPDRAGPDWFLVTVGDDAGMSLFVCPWDMVKDVVE
jgi:hypothetical protein